jgi:fructan beta-fructosidase
MKPWILLGCLLTTASGWAQPEQHRPLWHFSPPAKWVNDPNGMVYYKGEYHLFYQHYPEASIWGPMHWGHAISKDLVHWQHMPIALYPDSLGYIFSGSAVADVHNTTGFGKKGGETPLVAIYTYHDPVGEKANRNDFQTQGIAYSLDKGRTWVKYAGNPVIKNTGKRDFRDPKVFWHTASKRWVMILAVANHVEFYASKNLKEWEKVGEFGQNAGAHGGVWECPDLFPMKVVGKDQSKWVMIVNIGSGTPNGGSGTQYFIGHFDGKTFKNDNPDDKTLWLDYGKDNYAGVTWSNNPDGRRLLIGWMSNWQYANTVPTTAWRNAMTIPRELSLHEIAEGLRVFQKPVREVKLLRGVSYEIKNEKISDVKTIDNQHLTKEIEVSFDLSKTTASRFGIVLNNSKNENVEIGYDAASKQFYIDRTEGGKKDFSKDYAVKQLAPRVSTNNILKIRLLIDVASVELFADNGSVTMTSVHFPNEDFKTSQIFSKNGITQVLGGGVWRLNQVLKK